MVNTRYLDTAAARVRCLCTR